MFRSIMNQKGLLLLALLAWPVVLPGFAQETSQRPLAGSESSPLWCRHTILIYVSPSGVDADFWTEDRFGYVVAYRDQQGRHTDYLFDGFLFTGFSCRGGRHLLPLENRDPAVKSDWEDALANYMTAVEGLSQSFLHVAQVLGKPHAGGKVILAVPYPDPRQANFGVVRGKNLNLGTHDDRVEAVEWYVDQALNDWNGRVERGSLKGVTLSGFYWGHEGTRKSDDDLLKALASYVHDRGCLMHWIPAFGGPRRDWRDLGLDCVTQQINYQNPQEPGRPLTIFADMSRMVDDFDLHGVEMTPMARETPLNPRIWSWRQVHLANLDAALRCNWQRYPAMTYFHGNDIPGIAADPRTHVFYETLYKWMTGKMTHADVEQLSIVVLDELKRRGHIDQDEHARITKAETVLERLKLMEDVKLDDVRKAMARRLAAYSRSSQTLLRDGSLERGAEDWPTRSAGLTRTRDEAHHGHWSLRLSLGPGSENNNIRAYAKSSRIPVLPGQMVRFDARVKIPEDLRFTSRGLLLGLARYHEGKMVASWSRCEVARSEATDHWQRLSVHLFVDDGQCDEVLAIIGMCGEGVAYVDFVELVTLTKEENQR